MRLLIAICALMIWVGAPSHANEADLTKAQAFVTMLADDAITILKTSTTAAEREARFATLLNKRANMRRIAGFTLGSFGRKISKNKDAFAAYQSVLSEYIAKIYANRLKAYSDEEVVIGKARAKKRDVLVASRIIFQETRDPIDMEWRLRLEKDGSYTLFDLRVLGVSMAQEQRDSFAPVLKKNNGDVHALIDHLRAQIAVYNAAN